MESRAGSPPTITKPSAAGASGSATARTLAAAAAAATPLSFTLRMPADSSANFAGGPEEQQRALLAAFERALPGARADVRGCERHACLTRPCAGPYRSCMLICCLLPLLRPLAPAEGSAAEVTSAAPAPDGSVLLTVAASLPRGSSMAAEEAQYMATVLQNDAKQVRLPWHTLGVLWLPGVLCCSAAGAAGRRPE